MSDPLARLIRYVPAGILPPGVVATHNERQNITRIDKEVYDQMTEREQRRVFKSRAAKTYWC